MVVIVLAADLPVIDCFNDELDIEQAGKGYFFTYL
jgi:hypothetical protein